MQRAAGAAAQVGSAASEITQSSQSLAPGASSQAAALEEIAASLQETGVMGEETANSALQAKELADAARAGDAGMGFAVVAEEVRSLAKRSAEAAKHTSDQIEEPVRNPEAGVSINQQALQNLEEIDEHAARVTGVMADIAEAAMPQRVALSQVNQAVEKVNQVTQEAAAGSEEAAAASEELLAQAEEMQGMVGSFVISHSDRLQLRQAA